MPVSASNPCCSSQKRQEGFRNNRARATITVREQHLCMEWRCTLGLSSLEKRELAGGCSLEKSADVC